MVGGHIATKADVATLDEHKSDVQKQWGFLAEEVSQLHTTAGAAPRAPHVSPDCDMICGRSQHPDFVPYCTMQETYTGGVAKTVVGSKDSEPGCVELDGIVGCDVPTYHAP